MQGVQEQRPNLRAMIAVAVCSGVFRVSVVIGKALNEKQQ